MPLKYFICPNGVRLPIKQCLEQCPRDEGRCMALGNLISAADQREWKGTPSVTQLQKGTRQAYLEIKNDYAVDPDDMAYALLGVWHHQRLEQINKKLEGLAEYKVGGEITGILDRLEPDELNKGYYKLIDYKTSGAYAIAKAYGYKGADSDMRDWEFQLNYYRILLESDKELRDLFPVSRLFIQATVRDGGLASTKHLGLKKKMPLIPVRKLDDTKIKPYFARKKDALLKALKDDVMPPMCSYDERWGGRRCKGFCSVAEFCPEGAMVNRIPLKE